jgi:hypothetical protein
MFARTIVLFIFFAGFSLNVIAQTPASKAGPMKSQSLAKPRMANDEIRKATEEINKEALFAEPLDSVVTSQTYTYRNQFNLPNYDYSITFF